MFQLNAIHFLKARSPFLIYYFESYYFAHTPDNESTALCSVTRNIPLMGIAYGVKMDGHKKSTHGNKYLCTICAWLCYCYQERPFH